MTDGPPLPDIPGVVHSHHRANGVRLHVAEAGAGAPVLLLHGWPQHWYEWRHLIPALAPERRVICPDLRGFGWSDAPPSGYAIDFGSIRDATPEIRLAGDGVGTVILDNSQAPLVLDEAQGRVRYWVTGKFGVGDVHAIFVPGTLIPMLTFRALSAPAAPAR